MKGSVQGVGRRQVLGAVEVTGKFPKAEGSNVESGRQAAKDYSPRDVKGVKP